MRAAATTPAGPPNLARWSREHMNRRLSRVSPRSHHLAVGNRARPVDWSLTE